MDDNPQFTGTQYRPLVPPQHPNPYIPVDPQQFWPLEQPNIETPFYTHQPLVPSQLPVGPSHVGHILVPPLPAQPIPIPDVLPNWPIVSVSSQAQLPSNYMPVHSSYALSASSGGQIQMNMDPTSQYQSVPNTNVATYPVGYPESRPSGSQVVQKVNMAQQSAGQNADSDIRPSQATVPQQEPADSDWSEHTTPNGKRFYYNRRTKYSTWKKPLELMTPIERTDESTDWSEHTTPDGLKYYYNKTTKLSKWTIPDELKLARERLYTESSKGTPESSIENFQVPPAVSLPEAKVYPLSETGTAFSVREFGFASVLEKPFVPTVNLEPMLPKVGSSNLLLESSSLITNQMPTESIAATEISITVNTTTTGDDSILDMDIVTDADGVSAENTEEAKKATSFGVVENITAVAEKTVEQEPLVYENEEDAKNAFLTLLETSNIGSNRTWDQAMRVIINDRRYGALKTLAKRKQAFNEFSVKKKREEAEKRRLMQKLAREDFKKMLEESNELTSSSKWSKSIDIFANDERYIAVERDKDREDLFGEYILELEKKERAKKAQEYRRNKMEYIEFLKSCDFITARSQWRKIQDRLEVDERCLRLEKIDRFEIFEEYICELEKVEEEKRKLWLEEVRRQERKNRENFRKLMEEHVAAGKLTAKTHWRDFCMKVKHLPKYIAVASNTSGATPRDLFEDVAEELEKQLQEDKDRIADAMKLEKIIVSSTSTIEDMKTAISKHINTSPPVSDVNLKLVFDELQEKAMVREEKEAREREEKEAKRHKRQAEDFYNLLRDLKDITASPKWEDCKAQLEDRRQVRFNEDESFFRDIFENYVTELKEKAKRNERRRREEQEEMEREKRKQRRDNERRRKDKSDSESDIDTKSYSSDGNTKRSNTRDKDCETKKKRQKKYHRRGSNRDSGDE